MDKAWDHRRLAPSIVVTLIATAVVLSPLPGAAQRRPPPRTLTEASPKPEAAVATDADRPIYECDTENRMGNDKYQMFFDCDDDTVWSLPNGIGSTGSPE